MCGKMNKKGKGEQIDEMAVMPQISVIIPVYNAEKYLDDTIQTLIKQTFRNYEIICVIDCPTDKSLEIVKKYQNKDARIKVIENEINMGAAESRNRGIRNALSPYLLFLDADDIFEPDLLQLAYDAIVMQQADIVIYEHDIFSIDIPYSSINIPSENGQRKAFRLKDLPEDGLTLWNCVPWNKMFRKEFVIQNNLEYQNLRSSDDVYFSDMSMMLAEKIVHVNTDRKLLHHRVDVETQITAKRNPLHAWKAMKKVYDVMQEKEIWEEYKAYYYIKFLHTMTSDLCKCSNEEFRRETYATIYEKGGQEIGICTLDKKDFENPYYVDELRKFIEKEYESGWFEYHVKLYAQLRYYHENISKLLKNFQQESKKIALWGAGPGGRTVLQFCMEQGLHIDYVIDNNRKKQGALLDGKKIYGFMEIQNDVDVVIVTNFNYYGAIYQQVKEKNEKIEVINLGNYLN